jgi:hypothetical protein
LYEFVRAEGVEETISTIGHYLFSPFAWSKFARFIRIHNLEIIHTNQYYSTPLFEISDMREDKIGSIAANQEVYKAGIGGSGTPPVVMEIQSSMSAHLTGPEMEELYRLVFIQGINGLNYYMMAGGENHPDYVLSNGRPTISPLQSVIAVNCAATISLSRIWGQFSTSLIPLSSRPGRSMTSRLASTSPTRLVSFRPTRSISVFGMITTSCSTNISTI